MTAPKRVGPWTLLEELGRGGNAVVWRATHDDEQVPPAAVKVIHAVKAEKEPYKRFVSEIGFLRSLGDSTGVLPLVDAYLPETPSSADRPWLAMPIATPISDALTGADLVVVVEAMRAVARTLGRLKNENGVAHRDIKPGNLYGQDDEWMVGDFGLVTPPDKDELAKTGRPVGPAHYTAYELIIDPTGADPHPADVYSLAKTLWVLATGQGFPPEGHQAANQPGFNIVDWRPHPQAGALDRLIERCTRLPPEQRPTMDEVVADLDTWLTLSARPQAFDLGDLHQELRSRMATETAQYDRKAELKNSWIEAVRLHSELMRGINQALADAYPRVEVDTMGDTLTNNLMRTLSELGSRSILHSWQRCTIVPTGPEYAIYALRIGRGVEIDEDGELRLHAFVDVGDPTVGGTDFYWMLTPTRNAPAGTLGAEQAIDEVVGEIGVQVKAALEVFLRRFPDRA